MQEYLKEIFNKKLKAVSDSYNPECGLVEEFMSDWGRGYHSRYCGTVHRTRDNVEYAAAIILGKKEELYERAFDILKKIIDFQDCDENSDTFGLWGYYFEETLDKMRVPDYNWADFISKNLITAVLSNQQIFNEELLGKLKLAIKNAAICSINRDVAPDYTNISVMSSFCIAGAGEILGIDEYVETGRNRLARFFDYIEFNGSFSEYNSTGYTVITMEELSRIIALIKDRETVKTAKKLLEIGWKVLGEHYNAALCQHTPPYYRAYYDIDTRDLSDAAVQLPAWLYCGTNGKYGNILSEKRISFDTIFFHEPCPGHIMKLFDSTKERWIDERFYKKNDYRKEGYEYCTISNYDCPDLRAFSYMTDNYSMGAFDVIDGWNQRRSSMVIWGKDAPSYLRIRTINNGYDFCSGMVYTSQFKNNMLNHVGFVNDRGDFHFNLDRIAEGKIKTKELYFKIEFGGGNVKITKNNNVFTYQSECVTVKVDIRKWVFDGKAAEVKYNDADKSIYLICYLGEEKEIQLNQLRDTYGIIMISVNSGEYKLTLKQPENDYVDSVADINGIKLHVRSPVKVLSYGEALQNYIVR